MTRAQQYLQDAKTMFSVATSHAGGRHSVFDLIEAIVSARLAINEAPYAEGAIIRSEAGKIAHDAREAICALTSTPQ